MRVRIPPGAWMSVCCECCVLSGRGLSDELITRPEESYRLLCVVVRDLETSWMRWPWPTGGRLLCQKNSTVIIHCMWLCVFHMKNDRNSILKHVTLHCKSAYIIDKWEKGGGVNCNLHNFRGTQKFQERNPDVAVGKRISFCLSPGGFCPFFSYLNFTLP